MTHPLFDNRVFKFHALRLGSLLCLATAVLPLPAAAAPPATAGAYQRDIARCQKITVHGARANCLSEASTRHAATRPATPDADPGRYARNALERCKPLSEPDRSDCVARIQGQGTTSGSVTGGGLYRELVTREPATQTPTPQP